MRMVIGSIFGLLALMVPTLQSMAQDDHDGQLQAFTRSAFHSELINRALATLPPAVFQKCPSLQSNASKVTVLKPVSFGASGFPNAGSWKQTFPVSGCGNDTILNFYFSAGADEKINTVVGVPGTTHTSLLLGRDAVLFANIGANRAIKNCKVFDITNTRFESYGLRAPAPPPPGADDRLRPWWETWTMVGCGHTADVPIEFVPDATGTQIIQPEGAIER